METDYLSHFLNKLNSKCNNTVCRDFEYLYSLDSPEKIVIYLSVENFIFINFIAVKLDGRSVTPGICLYKNLVPDSWVDVTSVNFNRTNVYEDEIFRQQDILQFFSEESKEYKYSKCPPTLIDF